MPALKPPPGARPDVPLESIKRAHQLLRAVAEGETDKLLEMQGLPAAEQIEVTDLFALILEQQQTILALILTTHVATRELATVKDLEQSQVRDYVLWYVERTNAKRQAGG